MTGNDMGGYGSFTTLSNFLSYQMLAQHISNVPAQIRRQHYVSMEDGSYDGKEER